MLCNAGPDDEGRRLDRIVRKILPDCSLGVIYSALRKGKIKVNGKKRPPSYRLKKSDSITIPDDYSGDVREAGLNGGGTERSGTKAGGKPGSSVAASAPTP